MTKLANAVAAHSSRTQEPAAVTSGLTRSLCKHDDKASDVNTKCSFGKPYDNAEDALAAKIARVTRAEFKTAKVVGRIVDEWMQHIRSKPQWGAYLIARIARHPKLNVSRQWLYRCWNVHRLVEQHGQQLAKFNLHDSALVQLARITQAKHLTAEEQREMLSKCAKKAAEEKLNADAVRREVTAALRNVQTAKPSTTEEACVGFKCEMEVCATLMEKLRPLVAEVATETELANVVAGLECVLSAAVHMFDLLSHRAAGVAPAFAARLAARYENAATRFVRLASCLRGSELPESVVKPTEHLPGANRE